MQSFAKIYVHIVNLSLVASSSDDRGKRLSQLSAEASS